MKGLLIGYINELFINNLIYLLVTEFRIPITL